MRLANACPKPKRKRKSAPRYSSIKSKSYAEKIALLKSKKLAPRATKPLSRKAKNRDRNSRDRIYGPGEFRIFLYEHACLGCGYQGHAIQQAHRSTGGMGRKDDWQRTGPLCGPHLEQDGETLRRKVGCHALHDGAKKSWRSWKGRTFEVAQRLFFAEWLKVSGGEE